MRHPVFNCTLVACILLLCGPAGAAILRYECRAIDGSMHLFDSNLMRRFGAAFTQCRAIAVPEETAPQAAPRPEIVIIARQAQPQPKPGSTDPTLLPLPAELARLVQAAARRHDVDARLVQAVIQVESGYDARARSSKGALGLMQLMPATAVRFSAARSPDLFDPAVNIDTGVRYLRALADLFDNRIDLILAAYNAGEGAVMRHGLQVPPYPETQAYVRKIIGLVAQQVLLR